MINFIKDEQGIDRYDFKDLDDYKSLYTSESASFPNIDVEAKNIRNNYRWQIVIELIKRSHLRDIVDFGCGDGALCFLLEREGYFCDGVEIDPVVVEANNKLAKEWNSDCKFFHSSAEEFKTEDKYDIALALDVFEHFLHWPLAMKAIEDSVIDEGLVIVSTPEIDGKFGESDPSPHHINLHSEESLVQCFRNREILFLDTLGDIIFLVYKKGKSCH